MSDDEEQPYRLPTPDLGVFGEDADKTEKTEPPTEQLGDSGAGKQGTMRFQDESTKPRPPTLAEARARQQAQEAEQEAAIQAEQEAIANEERRRHRKRVMIGAGVTVGIVAVIGGLYLANQSNDVTARCTVNGGTDSGTVVQDQYCDEDYVTSHGGYLNNGIIFLPIPGGGYSQYHYYYGGSGNVGQRVSGGSYTQPSNATIKTNSGSTVSRGGLGVSGKTGGSGGIGGRSGGS
jgi:type II secretory pathway pseudopilin PulG